MKTAKKILIATVPLLVFIAVPGTANATGYVRVGDDCYFNVGAQHPVWVQMPCPDEVSENP